MGGGKMNSIEKQIREKEKLIKITESMIDCPSSEGGISRQKGNATIKLFKEDIKRLKNKPQENVSMKEIDYGYATVSFPDNSKDTISNVNMWERDIPKEEQEVKALQGMKSSTKENKSSVFWYVIAIISLTIFFAIIIYGVTFAATNSNTSKLLNTSNTSQNSITTPISPKVPTQIPIKSKFITTYLDSSGNLHQVEDYTSQGGNKYDTIIDTDISNIQKNVAAINTPTIQNKAHNSDIISDIKNSVINFYEENKPKQKSNSNLIGTWQNNAQALDVPLHSTMIFSDKYITIESAFGQAVSEYVVENDKIIDEKGKTIFIKFWFIDGRTLVTESSGIFENVQLIWHKTSWW